MSQPSSTPVDNQPHKSEPAYLAGSEQAQDQANQIPSPKISPSSAYGLGLMKSLSTFSKKSTPPLNVDVNRDAESTLPSPLRSASFNPSTKTQSIGSRISSRISAGGKKLYVRPSS